MKSILSVKRKLYMQSQYPDAAVWIKEMYIGTGLKRKETMTFESSSDWQIGEQVRYSDDNGKNWTAWETVPDVHPVQNDFTMETFEFARCFDPTSGKIVRMTFQRLLRGKPEEALAAFWKGEIRYWDHMLYDFSEDNGNTFSGMKTLKYEDGDDFDENNWAKDSYLHKNQMYGAYVLEALCTGQIAYAGTVPAKHTNKDGSVEDVKGVIAVIGNYEDCDYKWSFSKPITVSRQVSSRGFEEPCIVELIDGRLLLELRGSNTPTTPGRKWISVSEDKGKTWSEAADFRYDNGEQFYAPATFARFLRSSRNGKLYWIGNISPVPPDGNWPRNPIYIAEVDETKVALKKDSLTIIDDRDPQKDPEFIQFSNFSLLENSETQEIEIYITRLGENTTSKTYKNKGDYHSDAYKYIITVD